MPNGLFLHPDLVDEGARRLENQCIVVDIDARDGRVAVKGWEEVVDQSAVQLAQDVKRAVLVIDYDDRCQT